MGLGRTSLARTTFSLAVTTETSCFKQQCASASLSLLAFPTFASKPQQSKEATSIATAVPISNMSALHWRHDTKLLFTDTGDNAWALGVSLSCWQGHRLDHVCWGRQHEDKQVY